MTRRRKRKLRAWRNRESRRLHGACWTCGQQTYGDRYCIRHQPYGRLVDVGAYAHGYAAISDALYEVTA